MNQLKFVYDPRPTKPCKEALKVYEVRLWFSISAESPQYEINSKKGDPMMRESKWYRTVRTDLRVGISSIFCKVLMFYLQI